MLNNSLKIISIQPVIIFFKIVEIRTKLVSLSSLLLASLYLVWRGKNIDWLVLGIFSFVVVLLDMACTGFNSFFDFWNGTDTKLYNRENDKVLVHAGINPGLALVISLVLYSLAAIAGLILLFLTGSTSLFIGLISFLIVFFYSAGPWPISRGPFGELFAGGFLGFVVVTSASMLSTKSIDSQTILAALPLSLWIASILATNNACDRVSDAASGRKTFAVIVGKVWADIFIDVLNLLGIIMALVLAAQAILSRWTLVVLPLALFFCVSNYLKVKKNGYNNQTKQIAMKSSLTRFLFLVLSIILGFALDLLLAIAF